MVSHTALYGDVRDPRDGKVIDEVLVLPMLAPRSYTTEDVVEIHAHGGSVCVQRVLALLLRNGDETFERTDAGPAGRGSRDDDEKEKDAREEPVPIRVRLARPGEFTLRAFLNGRLDLTQAEAVHGLVSARTAAAADGALSALRGGLAGPVRRARREAVIVADRVFDGGFEEEEKNKEDRFFVVVRRRRRRRVDGYKEDVGRRRDDDAAAGA